jgi:alpha-tubulin suppressor-like RCC1 family protein
MRAHCRLLILMLAMPCAATAQARRPTRAAAAVRPPAPAKVWAAVSAGSGYTCALDNTGQAYCWGENLNRKLGIGDSVNIRRPVAVETPQRFQSIAAGVFDTCALTREGATVCWGGAQNPSLPHSALGELRLRQMDYASGGCGIAVDGIAWCWGANGAGQLGSGRESPSTGSVPERVAGMRRYQQVVVGSAFACGLTAEGAAWCWGRPGTLGTGASAGSNVPVAVTGNHLFTQLASGSEHVCGIAREGSAWCWGDNGGGALGTGQNANAGIPVPVSGGLNFKALSAGFAYTCGITVAGKAWCWGTNANGVLGINTSRNALTPAATAGNLVFAAISSANGHTCAITTAGALYCWGDNADGELGIAHAHTCRTQMAPGQFDVRPCAVVPTRVQDPR